MVDARGGDRWRITGRGDISKRAALRIGAREFRAHQYQLRRVVDPDQQNDEGGRRAIRRFEALNASKRARIRSIGSRSRGSLCLATIAP
jgi:hypothetical protein